MNTPEIRKKLVPLPVVMENIETGYNIMENKTSYITVDGKSQDKQ